MPNNIFVRILIAVVFCVILFAAIPVFLNLINFPKAAELSYLFDLCIAGVAIYYVIKGNIL